MLAGSFLKEDMVYGNNDMIPNQIVTIHLVTPAVCPPPDEDIDICDLPG